MLGMPQWHVVKWLDDGHPAHISAEWRDWLSQNSLPAAAPGLSDVAIKLEPMAHPSNSPDLNMMECIWFSMLARLRPLPVYGLGNRSASS